MRLRWENNFGRLVQFGDYNGGAKSFLPCPSDAFHMQLFQEIGFNETTSSIVTGPSNNANGVSREKPARPIIGNRWKAVEKHKLEFDLTAPACFTFIQRKENLDYEEF